MNERLPKCSFWCAIIGHEKEHCALLLDGDLELFQYGDWLRVEPPNPKNHGQSRLKLSIVLTKKDINGARSNKSEGKIVVMIDQPSQALFIGVDWQKNIGVSIGKTKSSKCDHHNKKDVGGNASASKKACSALGAPEGVFEKGSEEMSPQQISSSVEAGF
ncbi:hypothetical protein V6N13_059122 [Hibiscus sabdariffa]|uniref:Uncharacterized protein n=1 Tax=Hibiscus sabdariffa TaxID=183260 RepID=A0ABR2GDZ0_9ROSI